MLEELLYKFDFTKQMGPWQAEGLRS
jgi:hypothetical protein